MAARCEAYVFCACALAALVQLPGCSDDAVSVHVICPIVPDVEGNICSFDPGGDTCITAGIMNLAATRSYRQNFRVQSGLKARARDVPPQSETTRVVLQSAKVELRSEAGARIAFDPPLPNPYRVTVTGYIEPGGVGGASVILISPTYAARLDTALRGGSTQIVVAVTLEGETDGETSVSSGEYLWPVTLASASVDPAANECREIDSCSTHFGQDFYAFACRPE